MLITTRIGVDIDQYRDVLGMKTIEIMHPGYIHLHKAQKSIYSQFEQDGIIEAIFDLISTDNKVYIEIGGGSVNDNSYNLLMNGWNGYAINSGQYFMNEKTQNLQVINQLVTKENVNNILDELDGLPKDFDFLSIDIDSHDLAIWKAMDNLYCPKVVAMEFNSNFPMGVHAAINEDNTKFIWDGYSKNYGASFTSIVTAAKEKGYTYAYHLPFTDVFFVRNDVMPEKLKGIEPEDTFDSYPLHFPSFINQYDFVFGLNNEFLNEYSNGIVEEDFYKVLLHF